MQRDVAEFGMSWRNKQDSNRNTDRKHWRNYRTDIYQAVNLVDTVTVYSVVVCFKDRHKTGSRDETGTRLSWSSSGFYCHFQQVESVRFLQDADATHETRLRELHVVNKQHDSSEHKERRTRARSHWR